ncbi:PH domain-containing protein [Flavobacterium agricola]|uniref:PH domain-containing protein n=1 Tax=Flavobacterium agricola TaxID=2870839 RepID=A0ABY6M2S3_9FLAO|nr:PH domain-containing protein [Flavobacterium agricola]UYW01618.1 PH domain-containing protein [Flavobacterium agricola]
MINKPQRQEPIGVLIEISITLFKFLRAMWPLLLYFIFRKTEAEGSETQSFWYLGIFVVLALFISVLRFLTYRFYIDTTNQEFVLQRGILAKEKLIIALDRIFEVNLEQKYFHILLGVYKVRLDTAGSDKDEVVIQSLSKKDADVLRNYIINYKKEKDLVAEIEPIRNETVSENKDTGAETNQTIRISLLSLFKNSLVSNYFKTLGILLLFFNTIFENIKNFNEEVLSGYLDNFTAIQAISSSIAVSFILFVLLFLGIHIAVGVLQYFGYSITKNKQSLLIQYGLIQKFQTIVQPRKIQYYVFVTSKFMRLLNVNTLKLALIGNPSEKKQKSSVKIPALQQLELETIKNFLNLSTQQNEQLLTIKPNVRMLVAPMFLITFLLLLFCAYVYILDDVFLTLNFCVAIFCLWIVIFVVQYINFKRFTISVFSDKIIIKQGTLQTKITVLEMNKVQAVVQQQAWWHQKIGLTRLELKTAGGPIRLPIANQSAYNKVMNYVLYYVESTNISWA